jgi:hypothetical protein
MLLGAVYLSIRWLLPTPQERLTAFDATRAVPDEDNAALIYAQLLQGEEIPVPKWVSKMAPVLDALMDPMSLRESNVASRKVRELELSQGISEPNAAKEIALRPWRSAECPELRQWLNKHRDRLDKLQEAARKPSCPFPLSPAPGRMGLFDVPVGIFRQNALLLRYTANNDLGEGDIDKALAKCQSLLSIGRHLCMQPSASCLSRGIACEVMALHHLVEFIMEGHATDRNWQEVTAISHGPVVFPDSLRRKRMA